MRSHFARGLVAAMEQEELVTPADTPVEEAGAGAETLETELAEVVAEQADGEVAQAATDEAVETVEALESMIVALESAIQNGGLDKSGAAVMAVGLESMYSRVGLVPSKRAPALESFGGASSRQGATQMALESIKEQAKRIWEAIKAAIKKAVEWVMGYWNKFFGAAEKLKKRAEALQTRAEKTNGKAKESAFEDESIVKALFVGNAVAKSAETAEGLTALAKELFASRSNTIKGGEDLLNKLADLKKDGLAAELKASVAAMLFVPKGASKPSDASQYAAPEGAEVTVSSDLPGGKVLVQVSAADETIYKSSSVLTAKPGVKAPSNNKVSTLDTATAAKIAGAMSELAEELLAFRNMSSKGSELMKKLNGVADKAEKEAASGDDATVNKNLKVVQKLVSAMPKLVEQPYVAFSTYSVQTAKKLLDYVELSLKQYSEA